MVGVDRGSGSRRDGDPAQYGAVHVFTRRGGRIVRFREFVDIDHAIGG